MRIKRILETIRKPFQKFQMYENENEMKKIKLWI